MTCPACGGGPLVDHPAGRLTIDHGNSCPVRVGEDATHVADCDVIRWHRLPREPGRPDVVAAGHSFTRGEYVRPATPAERVLLVAQGEELPAVLRTHVYPITRGILRRAWPQLEPVNGRSRP